MIAEYLARMKKTLPDYAEYEACLALPPYRGVRVNTLKISAEEFQKISPFALEPVAWAQSGFSISEEKPGRTPYHDAGLFYVQEPSAMCAAPLLAASPGERVLDLCAAPGGKSFQLAADMRGKGILVLNEKVPARAAVLSENIERMGVSNAVVLCADPASLEERFAGYFDKVLVDAPCSGEGMFRKEAAALSEWSEENVRMCADRQRKILQSAVQMLRPGGSLVYSTCTFSEEEDEINAAWLAKKCALTLTGEHKLWPHRVRGEGHFAALFKKEKEEGEERFLRRRQNPAADKKSAALWRAFEKEFFKRPLEGELLMFGNALYLVPEGLFSLEGLKVLRAGIRLGEAVNGRFEPSHALALAAGRDNFCNVNVLSDESAAKFLRGEEVPANCDKGWCAAAWRGFALGLGKAGGNVMKNKYPKALRRP